MGTLTSWNPLGHSRPVTGLLYFYLYCIIPLGILRKIPWNLVVKLFLYVWRDPEGSRRLRLQEFLDLRPMKLARLSALRAGRLYLHRKYSWYSFLLGPESNPGPEGLCQWKNSSDPFGSRTPDPPACTALPTRTPQNSLLFHNFIFFPVQIKLSSFLNNVLKYEYLRRSFKV